MKTNYRLVTTVY